MWNGARSWLQLVSGLKVAPGKTIFMLLFPLQLLNSLRRNKWSALKKEYLAAKEAGNLPAKGVKFSIPAPATPKKTPKRKASIMATTDDEDEPVKTSKLPKIAKTAVTKKVKAEAKFAKENSDEDSGAEAMD